MDLEPLPTTEADDSAQVQLVGWQQFWQKPHKSQQQQEPVEPLQSKGDRRQIALYIRKIPVDVQLKDIQQHLRRQLGITLTDLRITQTIPSAGFRGRWKFVKCEGASSILEQVSKAKETTLENQLQSSLTNPAFFSQGSPADKNGEMGGSLQLHPYHRT